MNTQKDFLLFAGEAFYPGGGMMNYVNAYDTQDEAEAIAERLMGLTIGFIEWYHVVDRRTMTVVAGRGACSQGDHADLVGE